MSVTSVDYVIFFTIVAFSMGLGLYSTLFKKRGRDVDEVTLGSRSMNYVCLALSAAAGSYSSNGLVVIPSHVYAFGSHAFWLLAAHILWIPVVFWIIVPVTYNLKVCSLFQYIQLRYNRATRSVTSLLFILFAMATAASALFSVSVCFSQVTGLQPLIVTVGIGAIVTAYSAVGAFRGVVWADAFQIAFAFIGPVLFIGKLLYDSGLRFPDTAGYERFVFNFDPDPTIEETVWTMFIGMAPNVLYYIAIGQTTFQRYMAAPNLKLSKRVVLINIVAIIFSGVVCFASGTILYLLLHTCDPVTSGQIRSYDQIVPLYLKSSMSKVPGFIGVFLAAVASAGLSTISSHINSYVAITCVDFVSEYFNLTENTLFTVSRVLAFVYGGIITVLAVILPYLGTMFQVTLLTQSIYGGALSGLVLLGMIFPWVNGKGATLGFIGAVAFNLWMFSGRFRNRGNISITRPPVSVESCPESVWNTSAWLNVTTITATQHHKEVFYLFRISQKWYSLTSMLLTCILVIFLSFLTGGLTVPEIQTSLYSRWFLNRWKALGLLKNSKLSQTNFKHDVTGNDADDSLLSKPKSVSFQNTTRV